MKRASGEPACAPAPKGARGPSGRRSAATSLTVKVTKDTLDGTNSLNPAHKENK